MTFDDIKKAIDSDMTMSFTSQVALKVAQMAAKPDVTLKQIEEEISKGPVLTAKILKVVNSGFYGFSKSITTISRALMILGFNAIRGIAVSVWATENIPEDIDGFWDHYYFTGRVSGLVAEKVGYPKPEEAVLVGLLHDIGKIIFYCSFRDEFYSILQDCRENKKLYLDVEEKYAGATHAEIGAYFLEKWRLPDFFILPIRNHHVLDRKIDFYQEACIIHLADIICRGVNFGFIGDFGIPEINKGAWEMLKLSNDDLCSIINRTYLMKETENHT